MPHATFRRTVLRPSLLALLASAGVMLAACTKPAPTEAKSDAAESQAADAIAGPASTNDATSTASGPLPIDAIGDGFTYEYEDGALVFKASLPREPEAAPALARARASVSELFTSLKTDAAANQMPDAPDMKWSGDANYTLAAAAGGYVSLVGVIDTFMGGAHPNVNFEAVLTDATGLEMDAANFLNAGEAGRAAFNIAVCQALIAEKKARIEEATILGDEIVCAGPGANVDYASAVIALAPSMETGKFGGFSVYFAPYAVGAYAEGAYVVDIPHSEVSGDIKPEFLSLFGGSLRPASDDSAH